MRRFVKKPVEIEAMQWSDEVDNARQIQTWLALYGKNAWLDTSSGPDYLTIPTLEGEMRASPGDWIIRGVKGEFYPCKPDIFAATYEPAKE